jgi:hypothetical protein
MKAGKTERCIDLTLALNSPDELHYKRKATPNGKQKLPRAVLARQRARFVALAFIWGKSRLVMVNAGFRFSICGDACVARRNRALIAALIETHPWGREGAQRAA